MLILRAGRRAQFNARDYYHNIIIDRLFRRARRTSMGNKSDTRSSDLIREEQQAKKFEQKTERSSTANILNIPNKWQQHS